MAWKFQWPMRKHEKRPPAVEYIEIAGTRSHIAPAGLHLYAREFLEAAQSLVPVDAPFSPVRAYLVCRSIELSLKAYLSLTGIPLNKLAQKYGHDLRRLEQAATSKSLKKYVSLTPQMRSAIHGASLYYAEKVFEYPRLDEAIKAYPNAPDVTLLLEVSELLVVSLKAPCYAS